MHRPLSAFAALVVVAAMASPIPAMAQRERTKVGTLTCDISGGIGLDHHVAQGRDMYVHAGPTGAP